MKNDVMKKSGSLTTLRFSVLLINSLNDLLLSIIPCLLCDCLNPSYLQTPYSKLLLVIPSPADDLYSHPRKKCSPPRILTTFVSRSCPQENVPLQVKPHHLWTSVLSHTLSLKFSICSSLLALKFI